MTVATAPDRLIADLDARQRDAVTSDAAPLAILAGAGSGKTRVLTRRIAWLAAGGRIDPAHTLALTFTRKAAAELVDRLGRLGVRRTVTAGTFHSIALAQLRRRAAERRRAMPSLLARKARILVPLVGGRGAAASVAASEIAGEIEWAKARRITPHRYAEAVARAERDTPRPAADIARLYARYEQERRSKRLVDFDDLIWWCADSLRNDAEFAATQRWRFRHLFVDEFQDATPAQVGLLRGWLGESSDLTVVGDPDQSIYGFAGANPWYLTGFAKHFRGGSTVQLDVNYRSTPQVIAAARAALPPSARSVTVTTPRADGPRPTTTEHAAEADEAAAIAASLRRDHALGRPWRDSAVLYRTNAQSAAFEAAFGAEGVPFHVRGGAGFLARPEVRATLDELRRSAATAPGRDLVPHLDDLAHDDSIGEEQREHADTLAALAREFVAVDGDQRSVDGFVAYLQVALRGETDLARRDAVELLTFHRAKGLEFTRVYITGLERGLVPISHANTAAELAEEHRLLYVALSRAHEEIHLSWAKTRNGRTRTASPWLSRLRSAIGEETQPAPADVGERLAPIRRRLAGTAGGAALDPGDEALFDALKEWRRRLSRSARVPAYVVFDDRTLAAVARARPHDGPGLLEIPGIGPVKLDRYGDALLEVIARHG